MKDHDLQLPASCAMLDEKETTCTQGGGIIAEVFYAFGRMFSHFVYDTWDSESKTLQQAHGAVVSQKGNVYTYSDGYVYTADHGGCTVGVVTIGDFFYGIGDLFNAFGL